jgi:sulfatase maturation enzyme AslB (radical SAM superfamily)
MYKNKRAVACEMFSSAVCNIECNYCYIPKVKEMKNIHKHIIETMESGKYIEYLKNTYGDRLESLGFWGTEPTLTLSKVQNMLPQLLKEFPKLKDLSWSSNFITSPKVTIDFLNAIPKDAGLKITYQASLDGPHAITDVNRAPGATDKIIANILEMIKRINDVNLGTNTVVFNSKPTWGSDNLHYYAKDKKLLYEYYQFFEDLVGKMYAINKNPRFHIQFGANFSLAVPGRYTTEDGKLFSEILDYMYEIEENALKNRTYKYISPETNTYEYRLKRILDYERELITKQEMFTCSGGDSNYALDDVADLHICHRSLYLNNEAYIKNVIETLDMENWEVSFFDRPSVELVKDKWIVSTYDDYELSRFAYITGSYHHHLKLKLSFTFAMIKELVECGQIDPIFEQDTNLKMAFALFLNVAHSCPLENVLNTGIIHFTTASLFRLFGNGVFQKTFAKVLQKEEDKYNRYFKKGVK